MSTPLCFEGSLIGQLLRPILRFTVTKAELAQETFLNIRARRRDVASPGSGPGSPAS
jgi:hypothetical protein